MKRAISKITKSKLEDNFKIKITITGEVGSGKSQIKHLIYKALADAKYPRGLDSSFEHTIFCQLPD